MNLKPILAFCGLVAAFVPVGLGADAPDDFLPVDQAFHFEAVADGADHIKLYWEIAEGYYLYRNRIKASSEQTDVKLGALEMPNGEPHQDEYFGSQEIYRQELVATIAVTPMSGAAHTLKLTVGYQGCADKGLCYPPQKRQVNVELSANGTGAARTGRGAGAAGAPSAPGAAASAAAAATGANGAAGYVSEQNHLAALVRDGNLFILLGTFFVLGLALAFTPCCLPMVPILSGIISGAGAATSAGRGFSLALAYVLGMALTNTLAGVAAALAGHQIQALFQQPWIIALFGALFVIMALAMFGFFTVQMPAAIQTRLSDLSNRQSAGTYAGVVVMGALSALIVTACVAPPLVAALTVIGQSGSVLRGGSALFVLSIGMGTPLLLVGASAGKLLPRAGAWMDLVKKMFGVLMLAVAAWMFARIVPERWGLLLWAVPAFCACWLLITGLRGRSGGALALKAAGVLAGLYGLALVAGTALGGTDPLSPFTQLAAAQRALAFKRIKTVEDLHREVAAAKAAGKSVMLDFYADWCASCKEMEKYSFTDSKVRQSLAATVLLQADVTSNDDADAALLKLFDIKGPPTIAFFGRDGIERQAYRVVGFMKAGEFANVATRAFASGT